MSSPKTPQLTLDLSRKPMGRGGWRPNAGRPKRPGHVPHASREDFAGRHPQHVTLRIVDGVPSLRRGDIVKSIWSAIESSHREDFRIVEFSVEPNHLHLIIEATNKAALCSGVKGFEVRVARRLNRRFGRSGALFQDRYHMRALETPTEVKHALRYVLNNWRHHLAARGERLPETWIDPYSSALWFEGWKHPIVLDAPWKRELASRSPPNARPTVWLLREGWRRLGLIGFDEVPGRKR